MSRFSINDGSRPSRLQLARYHTGELTESEAQAVEEALAEHPELRAHLDELDAARQAVPPLDLDAIRARTLPTVVHEVPPSPEPANRPRWYLFLPLIVAALALFALVPRTVEPEPVQAPYVGVRGEPSVFVHHLIGDSLRAYDGRPLSEGDTIGLRVHPDGATGVVVLSVDGNGQAHLLYPDDGTDPEPLTGDGRTVALPGTLILDDAPGPEVFIAVFDTSVPDALGQAADRYDEGGVDALLQWGADARDVDIAVVERQ